MRIVLSSSLWSWSGFVLADHCGLCTKLLLVSPDVFLTLLQAQTFPSLSLIHSFSQFPSVPGNLELVSGVEVMGDASLTYKSEPGVGDIPLQ